MAGEGIFNMAFGAQKGQRNTSKYEGIVLNTIFNMVEADNYLKFTAEVPSTIGLRSNVYQTPPSWPSIEYSINGGEWEAFSGSDTLNISNGDNVRFRGVNTTMYGCGFTITGGVMASGSVMSLIDGIGNVKTMPSPVNQIGCFQMLFKDCTGLITAPRLTARTLSWYCYNSMFYGCTSLTSHSDIPASEIPSSAMMNMFYGCTSLEHAGDIKATVVGQNACLSMYEGCESLETAPEMSFEQIGAAGCDYMFKGCISLVNLQDEWGIATIGDSGCFGMFYGCTSLEESAKIRPLSIGSRGMAVMYYGCTSLVVLHDLPCVELGQGAYNAMCYGCTSLSSIPSALPCTNLPDGLIQYGYFGVYQSMFEGCTSITAAPSLPAMVPSNLCYMRMFYGCVNLDNVNSSFVTWNTDGRCTEDWLYGVAVSGTFTGCGSLQEEYGASRIPQGWGFTRSAESPLFFRCPSQTKISISGYFSHFSTLPELKRSMNGYVWEDWDYENDSITVNAGGYLFLKCKSHNDYLTESFSAIMWFLADSDVYAGGNIISLLDDDYTYAISHDYAFMQVFSRIGQYLKTCPDIPHKLESTAKGVFRDMFSGCTGITSCDVVFDKAGSNNDETCYNMFASCTSLESATIGNIQADCRSMFSGCSSLTMISVGFNSWYAGSGIKTFGWVRGVASSGTFACPSSLQQYFGDNYIPTGWNVVTHAGNI